MTFSATVVLILLHKLDMFLSPYEYLASGSFLADELSPCCCRVGIGGSSGC